MRSTMVMFLFFLSPSCSQNQEIVKDWRQELLGAAWEPQFITSDNGSGVVVVFTIPDSLFIVSMPVRLFIQRVEYPLDTVLHVDKSYDVRQPEPGGGIADVTRIFYELKNKTAIDDTTISTLDSVRIPVKPGLYLVTMALLGSYGSSPPDEGPIQSRVTFHELSVNPKMLSVINLPLRRYVKFTY